MGWAATAIFTASYLCREPKSIKRIQALGAVVWLLYGVLIHSLPVIISNVVVAGIAFYSSLDRRAAKEHCAIPGPQAVERTSLTFRIGTNPSSHCE